MFSTRLLIKRISVFLFVCIAIYGIAFILCNYWNEKNIHPKTYFLDTYEVTRIFIGDQECSNDNNEIIALKNIFQTTYKRVKKSSLSEVITKYDIVKLILYKENIDDCIILYLSYPDMKVFYEFNDSVYEMDRYSVNAYNLIQRIYIDYIDEEFNSFLQ